MQGGYGYAAAVLGSARVTLDTGVGASGGDKAEHVRNEAHERHDEALEQHDEAVQQHGEAVERDGEEPPEDREHPQQHDRVADDGEPEEARIGRLEAEEHALDVLERTLEDRVHVVERTREGDVRTPTTTPARTSNGTRATATASSTR